MKTLQKNSLKFIILFIIIFTYTVIAGENMLKVLIVIGSEKGSTLEIGNKMKAVLEMKALKVDCIAAPKEKLLCMIMNLL